MRIHVRDSDRPRLDNHRPRRGDARPRLNRGETLGVEPGSAISLATAHPRPRIAPNADVALAWHLMMRLADSRVIARSPRERRVVAHTLFARGEGDGLLAFRVADTHIHSLLTCTRSRAGQFARHAASSLRQQLDLPVAFGTHFRAVLDQRHLYNTFRYVLRQEERHQTHLDPTHDGSSLLDLVGLRVIAPWNIQRVRTLLPRVQSAELHAILGVDLQPELLPVDLRIETLGNDSQVTRTGVEHLRESAEAAIGTANLGHRGPVATAARAATANIARAAGLSHRRIAGLLALDERSVRRLLDRPFDPTMSRAIALQLRLRSALSTERLLDRGPPP